MFRILLLLFILVPIVEIAVFIQVGEQLGLGLTLVIVFVTAILGVNLLKQQGFKAWHDIQLSIQSGRVPAIEMASAAQLLFAGGLLLTPGFVTDSIGFLLMIPKVRELLSVRFIALKTTSNSHFYQAEASRQGYPQSQDSISGRTVEGEFEDKSSSPE
ncbi:MAG: FxsA family protein [Enterobacterales bacterium]|nr:FxsA family protein [Enterobacterales bacterium]